ncbi:MAG: hypothetical protein EOP83_21105 [Verrucomicrobiaceae bacterium]|nr:MAG: hypothetical protein EOP83_21105 [Verrucomicrobiaceae bacterium]
MSTTLIAATCEHPHLVEVILSKEKSASVLAQVSAMLDRVGAKRGVDWALKVQREGDSVRLWFTAACESFIRLLGRAVYGFMNPPETNLLDNPQVQAALFGTAEDSFVWS